ncbi:hypothetical protein K1Y38_27105 [Serratia marcescens]|uniref:hypothetical protein n=1 Tax=Serratia marcescens TaxID=615 RepID=UPI0022371359|nr:hypothetical protein [Serratia marcescens]MCW6016419.1 hypothetical protein [Serratia marcescens]MCW6025656.1 hypothetical protein [Serratia marcescens]
MSRSKYSRYVVVGSLMGLSLLASGCAMDSADNRPASAVSPAVPSPTPSQAASRPAADTPKPNPVVSCQKTLDSLQVVNPSAWKRHKAEFDTLIRTAAQYGAVRDGVSDKTKGTVDAMYQFRTSKICSDIENEVMDALISHGEKAAR